MRKYKYFHTIVKSSNPNQSHNEEESSIVDNRFEISNLALRGPKIIKDHLLLSGS